MKIIFVENRYKTHLYESIADKLIQEGYEIYFLIQNHSFIPSSKFQNHIIKYPKSGKQKFERIKYVEDIIKSDRQINHFKTKNTGYFYYYDKAISDFLRSVSPDIVFGESTAFHELLTIENCKKLGLLYLNPSTCRYPRGRFSFYKGSTLTPYKGSGKNLEEDEAMHIINQILVKKVIPDYMKIQPKSFKNILMDKFKKVFEFMNGEKFNTPNPIVKLQLEKAKKELIEEWDIDADHIISTDKNFKILYPLQMQPEANIDVWGKKYRNQTELIKKLSLILPENTTLYVKPNPKSKYELSHELHGIVSNASNIKHLHHLTNMEDILPKIDLVITVTGTIAIECILGNTPVITLIKTINNQANNCKYLCNLEKELSLEIDSIKKNGFSKISTQEKIEFINTLNKTSYKGIISDPFSDINCITEENINDIFCAFLEILKTNEN